MFSKWVQIWISNKTNFFIKKIPSGLKCKERSIILLNHPLTPPNKDPNVIMQQGQIFFRVHTSRNYYIKLTVSDKIQQKLTLPKPLRSHRYFVNGRSLYLVSSSPAIVFAATWSFNINFFSSENIIYFYSSCHVMTFQPISVFC